MKLTALALAMAAAARLAEFHPYEQASAASPQVQPAQTQPPAAAGQQEPRRRREVSAEERAKIEAALPAKALAAPRSAEALVFDRQVNYGARVDSLRQPRDAVDGREDRGVHATLSSEPGRSPRPPAAYDAVF